MPLCFYCERNAYKILIVKPEVKRPFGRCQRHMVPGCGMESTCSGKDQLWNPVTIIKNKMAPKKVEHFFQS
jgi:hypothetical protein